MTPSEQLLLRISQFADSAGKGRWRATDLPALSTAVACADWGILVDALDELHRRQFLEFRQWNNDRIDWIVYDKRNREYFYRCGLRACDPERS
jgi:hypothetical protein